MEELLLKLNAVNKHNEIIRLKNKLKKSENDFTEISNDYRNALLKYDRKMEKIRTNVNLKINELEKKNQELEEEKDAYKNMVNNIPSFFIRIFNRKQKLIQRGK